MLFLHVKIVEAGDVAPGSHKNMAGRRGLWSRDDDSVLARGQRIVWRRRAEDGGSQQVSARQWYPGRRGVATPSRSVIKKRSEVTESRAQTFSTYN